MNEPIPQMSNTTKSFAGVHADDSTVLLGPPTVFTGENIDDFDF